MQTIATLSDLRRARTALAGRFGLVHTRGSLHRGQLSLVERARAECDHLGVSVVTEAGSGSAPADLDRDLALLRERDVDLAWVPAAGELEPPGAQTWVTVERASAPLEGRQHPDHFRGLTTLLARLFNLFSPSRVYVGQKDAQENIILERMVRDLAFPLEVVVCPTVREADGLALSRRNRGLSPPERQAAAVLYRALEAARQAFAEGERDGDMLRACLSSRLASEPLAREEYVSAADPQTLDELERVAGRALLSLAARVGKTRLIDNLIVGEEP